jgi:integrase
MASITKHGKQWRAQVYVQGRRASKIFKTQREAKAWAADREHQLADSPQGEHTVEQLFNRYADTYSSRKKTADAEIKRCQRLARELGPDTKLADLTSDALAEWRDTRLREVSAASVRRDWSLLSHVLNVAVREYQWLRVNPLTALTRPEKPRPREAVWSNEQVAQYLHCAGWPGDSLTARTGDCLLFALETAMRAGEITRLTADDIHDTHVHLPETKNGTARDVPLTEKAREILDRYPKGFGLTDNQLNSLFRKVRDRANLDGLRFHDARRTALTRLSKKLDALELARVSGHKDLRILLEVYYQPKVQDLAEKLRQAS